MPLLNKTFKSSIYTIPSLFNRISNTIYRNNRTNVNKHFKEACSPILQSYLGNDYENHIDLNSNEYQKVKVNENSNLGLSLYVVYWPKHFTEHVTTQQYNSCLTKVIKGSLKEHRIITNGLPYQKPNLIKTNRKLNTVSFHDQHEIYKTVNPTPKHTVSLNLYIS